MIKSTKVDVKFITSNTKPEQELHELFSNFWSAIAVKVDPQLHHKYQVSITGLNLSDSLDILNAVIKHCEENDKALEIEVSEGTFRGRYLGRKSASKK